MFDNVYLIYHCEVNFMAEVINGTSGNDRLTAISDASVKAGAGNDTINIAGAQNVTIETGSGKDEIIFPYEGYDNPNVTFTDFDPQNDVLNFPEWAFFYKNYYFRATVQDGNLALKDGLDWYTLTFQGVTSTDEIKDTFVKKWDGYTGKLGGILYNTISGSSSHDINQSAENVTYLTNGDDEFTNHHSNVRIEALSGNDSIENLDDYGNVYTTTTYNVTINGGDGKDTIKNYQNPSVSIYGGNGNDNIFNAGNYTTVDGGNDDDTINNFITSNCYIYGGSGKDYIHNQGSRIIIDTGDDDDTVYNIGNYVLINGRTGNDSIRNINQNVTIIGGKGDDSIDNSTETYQSTSGHHVLFDYTIGDGNDIIWGFYHTSTISISGSSYNSVTSGNDVIIKVGNGSIILKDAIGTELNIIGSYDPNGSTSGEDTLTPTPDDDNPSVTTSASSYDANTKTWMIYDNYGDEAIATEYNAEVKNIIVVGRNKSIKIIGNELDNLISGGNAGDELFGENGSDIIHGNGGKDTLHGGDYNDILYGDQGNDELHGDGGNDELYGGDGEDILFGTDGKNTLNGGKDSDTFVGGKGEDIFVHGSGDGNDLILEYSFEQGDKLKFEDELIEDVKIDGTDVIITTENGEKLTVKYAAGQEISYINPRGNTETIDHNGNKPKSADSIYIKATRLMNSATKTVDSTKNTAANTLYDSTKTEANFAVNELKKSIKISTFRGSNLKKAIYQIQSMKKFPKNF